MEPITPDPVPTMMRWRFKQLKKLLKETVTMTPNNGAATVRPGQRIIVDLPTVEARKKMFQHHLPPTVIKEENGLVLSSDLDYNRLAEVIAY